MDVLILSRIQFGLSVGIHFLFPVTTLGLAFYIMLAEGLFLKTGNDIYRNISTLGVKILGLIFAMGVATGLILPFAFGTNWSNFVNFAGSVFGVHLTIEAIVAFMLESTFLGVLLFGRNRVSKGVYFLAAVLVFFGSHLSGFIIISANSWMQTPFHSLQTLATGIPVAGIDGFHLQQLADGSYKIVLDDVMKIMFSPSTVIRFFHTITATWLCGAVVMAAITGFYMLKHKHTQTARKAFALAVIIGSITAVAQPILGHTHIMEVLEWQPTKNASMEGIFKTQNGAPLYAIGFVNEETRETYAIGMPFGLSFLESWRFDSKVEGLDNILAEGKANMAANNTDAYKASAPPVQATFQMFHLMVMCGMLLLGGMVLAVFMVWRKQWQHKWLWIVMVCLVPLPYFAVEGGWIGAEIGRQPWIIYGLMKTSDAVSLLPVPYVGFSLIIFSLVYITLAFLLIKWLPRIIRESLEEHVANGPAITGDTKK